MTNQEFEELLHIEIQNPKVDVVFGPEPSLYKIIKRYYSGYLSEELTKEVVDGYINNLKEYVNGD